MYVMYVFECVYVCIISYDMYVMYVCMYVCMYYHSMHMWPHIYYFVATFILYENVMNVMNICCMSCM